MLRSGSRQTSGVVRLDVETLSRLAKFFWSSRVNWVGLGVSTFPKSCDFGYEAWRRAYAFSISGVPPTWVHT